MPQKFLYHPPLKPSKIPAINFTFLFPMLTPDQNTIVYLMFLNGILFLGLNFIAYSLVFPGPKGSKRIGYVLIVTVILVITAQQEYQSLIYFEFAPGEAQKILLFGMILPVFLISAVYYRLKKNYLEKKSQRISKTSRGEKNAPD
jgi:hypothetical protein